MPKPKTRSVEMYVGRVEPRDWYVLDIDVPACTPEDKIAKAAGEALTRILSKGNARAALWGVYQVPDGAERETLARATEPGEASPEQAVAELGEKLRDAVAETGVFVTSHMDELIGLLEESVSEYLQDAADPEEDGEPRFAHRYPKLCPFCQSDLARPESVKLCYTVGDDEIYETPSRLDETGLLEDVNDLIANGYHSDTTCSKCLNSLAEHELERFAETLQELPRSKRMT
jgi:hypothetical protein